MPRVYMFPNPKFGMPTGPNGEPEKSAHLADPHVAHLPGVKGVVGATARTIAARSTARLNTVKATSSSSDGSGGSRIRIMSGIIDQYVVLDDTRSDSAAWIIEKEHGILSSSTPRGRKSLAGKTSHVTGAEHPDRKPPKGMVIRVDDS